MIPHLLLLWLALLPEPSPTPHLHEIGPWCRKGWHCLCHWAFPEGPTGVVLLCLGGEVAVERVWNKTAEFVGRRFYREVLTMYCSLSSVTKRFHHHMVWTLKMSKVFLNKMGFQAHLFHRRIHKKKVKKFFKKFKKNFM